MQYSTCIRVADFNAYVCALLAKQRWLFSGRPPPPPSPPPPPPPPPPGKCGKCPTAKPVLYGSSHSGYYCKAPNATGGHECCLLPSDPGGEACQGVARCGSNPSNYTPCDVNRITRLTGAASIGPALDRVRKFTDKPIIFIAQAFGGGEAYPRAPTAAEERLMTCERSLLSQCLCLIFD